MLRQRYKEEAKMRKHSYALSKRMQSVSGSQFLQSLRSYNTKMLVMSAEDEVLYKYQQKLKVQMQFHLMLRLPMAILLSYVCFRSIRLFKKASQYDFPIYFMAPFAFYINSLYFSRSKNQFEIGYPAHPKIIDERRKVIN